MVADNRQAVGRARRVLVDGLAASRRGLLITEQGLGSVRIVAAAAAGHVNRGTITVVDQRLRESQWMDAFAEVGGADLDVRYVTPQLLVRRADGRRLGSTDGVLIVNGDRYDPQTKNGRELRQASRAAANRPGVAILGLLHLERVIAEFGREHAWVRRAGTGGQAWTSVGPVHRGIAFGQLVEVPLSAAHRWTWAALDESSDGPPVPATGRGDELWESLRARESTKTPARLTP